MSFAKIALVTLALSAAPTIAAHAQSFSSELGSGNLVMIDSAGQLKTMQLTEAGMTMVMKGARKLPAGTLIVRSGSSFYAIKDKRMGDGRMMSSVLTDPAKGYIR
ncbi:MAG: hypothetical protein HXX10_22730 [Rhodoplanes sp.]|uniref:hypothetical protein n=1 Tax=Rhodoplanes sp. TaxID=1968906 RepID=UPI0018225537|nr:hypothetical protein [Rhodoplanes sp.]NVO16850.1 hypothetical protein [Rhodoplanes sp.]